MEYRKIVKELRENSFWAIKSFRDLMNKAADAIEELTRENESLAKSVNEASEILRRRWISTSERLPEEEVEVLISDNSFLGGPIVAVAYWKRGKCEWRDDMSTAATPKPTHWMPLPTPPKEETE